ncbi:flippase [Salibacteraceae bacterium]|nr:flippase [Salibacteraceae bacterium]
MSSKKTTNSVSNSKGLFRGSFALIGYRLGAILVSYFFTWLIARLYGASVVGMFALMNVVVLIGVLLSKSGLDTLFLREISKLKGRDDNVERQKTYSLILGIQLFTGLGVSLLIYSFSDLIALRIFDQSELGPILKYAAFIVLPLTYTTLHAEGMRGSGKLFWYLSFTRVWPYALAALAMLGLYVNEVEDSNWFFFGYFASVVASSVFALWIWLRESQLKMRWSVDLKASSALLRQSFPMLLSSSMFLLMSWTDTFMLGLFEDTTQVGYYHVAVKVSNMVAIVLYGINGISAPKIASSWAAKDTSTLSKVISSAATLSFTLSLPVVFGILFFRSELLAMFGEGMHTASYALIFLSLGQFVNGSCGSVMNILQMTGHQKYGQYILISAGLLNVTLNYLLIPTYGIEGAAVATGVSTAYWNLLSVMVVRWKIGHWSFPFATGINDVVKLIKGRF